MRLNEILKEFGQAMTDIEKITVVETFFAQFSLFEGAIAEAYVAMGCREEYARDQVELSIRAGAGTDELLQTEELKQYFRLKRAAFSAMGFMYQQRINDDLIDVAWEAFQIATPQGDRTMFDQVRVGDKDALAALAEIHKPR